MSGWTLLLISKTQQPNGQWQVFLQENISKSMIHLSFSSTRKFNGHFLLSLKEGQRSLGQTVSDSHMLSRTGFEPTATVVKV